MATVVPRRTRRPCQAQEGCSRTGTESCPNCGSTFCDEHMTDVEDAEAPEGYSRVCTDCAEAADEGQEGQPEG